MITFQASAVMTHSYPLCYGCCIVVRASRRSWFFGSKEEGPQHRCCLVRESYRKSDLSRRLPASSARSFPVSHVQDNVTFKGGTPHGFETLRRWVALFGNRAAVERVVWGAWHGGVCEDHRRQVHGTVPRIWLRGDVLGCRGEGRDHGAQWLGHGWPLVNGQ